jgi:exosortase A
VTDAAALEKARQSWLIHVLALALLVLLIAVEFRDAVLAAVEVWWIYPTYSHCFLILPISLWLVWEKREQLAQLQPVIELRALWAIPPILFVWWLGELSTINEVRQFAVVGLMQVAIVAMLGFRIYRMIWFPVLYLFFLVPTGEYLIGPMQRFATRFTDVSLNLLGVPHYVEGTVFELPNGRYQIAEACAGLRFMIATVTLGILFAHLMFRRWSKIALFMLACVIVPLIGNGLRIVGIILLANYTSNEYGAGADHLVYGWGFNVAILLVLFLIGSRFRDSFDENTPVSPEVEVHNSLTKTVLGFLAAALLISLGPAAAWWQNSGTPSFQASELSRPMKLSGWHLNLTEQGWQPDYPGIDAKLAISLLPDRSGSTAPVDLYVGYIARTRVRHTLSAHIEKLWGADRWTLISSSTVSARLNGHEISMQEWKISSLIEKRLIWTSYWVDNRFTASLLNLKLLQAKGALDGNNAEALVAVSTVIDGTDDDARHRLSSAITALGDLPDRLSAASHRRSTDGHSN